MRGRPGPGLIFAMWHHGDFSYTMSGFSAVFHVESTGLVQLENVHLFVEAQFNVLQLHLDTPLFAHPLTILILGVC